MGLRPAHHRRGHRAAAGGRRSGAELEASPSRSLHTARRSQRREQTGNGWRANGTEAGRLAAVGCATGSPSDPIEGAAMQDTRREPAGGAALRSRSPPSYTVHPAGGSQSRIGRCTSSPEGVT